MDNFMANDYDFLFLGAYVNTVFACVTSSVHVAWWFMLQLEVMSRYWCGRYMHCAICSLQLYTVINVHSVHSVLLLMWLIYIKSFPISQSRTVPSYRERRCKESFSSLSSFTSPHICITIMPHLNDDIKLHTHTNINTSLNKLLSDLLTKTETPSDLVS